jgi:hypothetical protein
MALTGYRRKPMAFNIAKFKTALGKNRLAKVADILEWLCG